MGTRRRILILTLLPVAVIYAVIATLSMVRMQERATEDVELRMTELSGRGAAQLEGRLEATARIATTTAKFLETAPDATPEQLFAQLRANVELDPFVYGAAIAFEPGAHRSLSRFAPYVYRGPGRLRQMDIAEAFDYTDGTWQWWDDPRSTGEPVWTDPYFDEGAGNILMSTWSVPFTRRGRFRGVTTVDIPLAPLPERVGIESIRDLDFRIVTSDGEFVYHPDPERILGETVHEFARRLGRDDVAELGRRIVSGTPGFMRLPGWGEDASRQWVFYAPIESAGWSFVVILPEREALAGLREQRLFSAGTFAVSFVLIAAVIWFVSGLIARPLAGGRDTAKAAASTRVDGVRNRLKILGVSVVTLTLIAMGVAAVTILLLYGTARDEQGESLANLVRSQARLIEAVARFDEENSGSDAAAATLGQVVDAHERSVGLGETGEILLARVSGDAIEFLLRRRHEDATSGGHLSMRGGDLGEPVRRALAGKSGTDIVTDYRGVRVLASYEPIEILDVGLVAKMDMAEIRAPFVRAAMFAGITGILLVLAGAMLMVAVNNPLIKQVEDSESQVRTILATAREGFWFVDNDAVTLEANPALCEIVGREREDIVGTAVDAFTDTDGAGRFHAHLRGEGGAFEATVIRPGGEQVPCLFQATPFHDDHGSQVGSFALVTDLTERKQYETELLDAREAAEAANRAKSEFLSNMSHELRTPLNGVLGYAQILRRDPSLGGRQRENLDSIESCGQHLLTLINDVLDLSKIEAGRLELDRSPCDLHKLIRSVFDIVKPRAEAKGLAMDLDVSPEVPRGIITDATKLKQTLVNLLGNAVKFTETGTVTLRVEETADKELEMVVTDTGIGMTEEEAAGIFDPFKQAAGGKSVGGTGLGLAISKRIIEALGGSLAVESRKGEGSRFAIHLPMEEVHEEAMTALEEVEDLGLAHPVLAPGQDVRILVTDDRRANRDILVQLLETAGFATEQAANGLEALERMRAGKFDLVLMDVRMPEMNGIEATQAIRQDPTLRETPVIAVTASVFPEFRNRIAESGFDDFIAKPFRTSEIFATIEHHVDVTFEEAESLDAGEDAAADATPTLPPEVVREILERLRPALKVRNLTALNQLAAELKAAGDGRAGIGEQIEERARAFDFTGLDTLADGLESASGA